MLKGKIEEQLKKGQGISLIELVDDLIEHAHKMRSSDIHIDPVEQGLRVRFRIDGVLQDAFMFPEDVKAEAISRIKVVARLRTDEHQVSQDGRFSIKLSDGTPIDVRVSIAPTYYGENAVLRLLSDKAEDFNLEKMGFSSSDQEKINNALRRTYGMILVTGPTGSGKTTTLYTVLKMLNTKEVSIITIEDPIEYAVGDVNQMQVNHRAGLTFANGLRSILRQDPDIIMVGEIRDTETAALAINTSLTGHLLLSTLHTNDAATTLPRLLDMGIEPYLIASTVNLIIGQRLVRKLCTKCKSKKVFNTQERESLKKYLSVGKDSDDTHSYFYGKGCDECNNTGYNGRIGIYEVMEITQDIRNAFLEKASSEEIKKIASLNNMVTMIEDGISKARQGLTTIEEVLRVINE